VLQRFLDAQKNNHKEQTMKVVTTCTHKHLIHSGDEIVTEIWPEFMLNDPVANEYFFALYSSFPAFQYRLIDGDEVVGAGNAIPLYWDAPLSELPDAGWDWALATGFAQQKEGIKPNLLCALSITINPRYQGKGISGEMVKAMKNITREHGLDALILPVRPNAKHQHPHMPMSSYMHLQRDDNLPQDPWLRVHTRLGAAIIKECPQSMTIPGTIEQWTKWTGRQFPASGSYIIDGALVPVKIDLEHNLGLYIEPNVWMVHSV
jgi:GNAT superfamily N-acetyltransferase